MKGFYEPTLEYVTLLIKDFAQIQSLVSPRCFAIPTPSR